MDMTTRSFVLAAALAFIGAAGLIGWSLVSEDPPWPGGGGERVASGGDIVITGGSMMDEFGEPDRMVVGSRFDGGRDRFGSGPRFDWSGRGELDAGVDPPRTTPAERVEADCRVRGGASYGCRCLVRLARRDLTEAEFAFLSLAEERTPRGDRLQAAGLEPAALAGLASKLIALDVEARRRCGAGLAY